MTDNNKESGIKVSINDFVNVIDRYNRELSILVENINRYQTYPDTRLGKTPERHDILADKQLSILLTQADITIGMKNMVESKGLQAHFEEYYFARILALNCYEILQNHYPAIFNEQLETFRADPNTANIMVKFSAIRDQLKLLKRKHGDYLMDIRHNVIAHRHFKNGFEQNRLMWVIDPERILKISMEIQSSYISMMPIFDELQRAIL
jgi:hypothetical protein